VVFIKQKIAYILGRWVLLELLLKVIPPQIYDRL